nr:hypothetical protein CFP56_40670 [Quercus suber]
MGSAKNQASSSEGTAEAQNEFGGNQVKPMAEIAHNEENPTKGDMHAKGNDMISGTSLVSLDHVSITGAITKERPDYCFEGPEFLRDSRFGGFMVEVSLSEEEVRGADVPQQGEATIHRLGELKIRDSGGNILLFEFEDELDLLRVLEFEPRSYDKNLVVFESTLDTKSVPNLTYSKIRFWVQLHNIPEKSMNQETGEAVGKGRLKKEDQQYGEWLEVDHVRPFRKTVVVVFDSSHVPYYWKKGPLMEKNTSTAKTPMNKVVVPKPDLMSDVVQSLDEVSNENLPIAGAFQAPIKYGLSNLLIIIDQSRTSLLRQHSSNRHDPIHKPLCDILNVGSPLASPVIGRKWKKLAREGGDVSLVVEMAVNEHCWPFLDASETGLLKKKRLDMGIVENKENFPVVAGP